MSLQIPESVDQYHISLMLPRPKLVLWSNPKCLCLTTEECRRQASSSHPSTALLKELANWRRKPTSYEFQQRYWRVWQQSPVTGFGAVIHTPEPVQSANRSSCTLCYYTTMYISTCLCRTTLYGNGLGCFDNRVKLQKRKMLEHYDLEQEVASEALKKRKLSRGQTLEKVKGQLQVSHMIQIMPLS